MYSRASPRKHAARTRLEPVWVPGPSRGNPQERSSQRGPSSLSDYILCRHLPHRKGSGHEAALLEGSMDQERVRAVLQAGGRGDRMRARRADPAQTAPPYRREAHDRAAAPAASRRRRTTRHGDHRPVREPDRSTPARARGSSRRSRVGVDPRGRASGQRRIAFRASPGRTRCHTGLRGPRHEPRLLRLLEVTRLEGPR